MDIKLAINQDQELNSAGNCTSGRLIYLVNNAVEGAESAMQLARTTAPDYLGTAKKRAVELLECKGNGIYKIAVRYEKIRSRNGLSAGDRQWSFNVHTGKVHTNEAVALIKRVSGENAVAPDPGISVGWNGKKGIYSQISGIDTAVMEMRERCTATYLPSSITSSFKRGIMELTGKVNSNAFHGWNAGEVLFLGAVQGNEFENSQGTTLVNIYYDFAIRPNTANYMVSNIDIGAVKGWHHVWNIANSSPAQQQLSIAGIYVSQIYQEASFNSLGL